MFKKLYPCCLIAVFALVTSCATGKLHIVTPSDTGVAIDGGSHRLFLVGDAGENTEIFRKNMALLQERLRASPIPATVVYLGDNIYPRGVPGKDDSVAYKEAVDILEAQIRSVEGLTVQTLFLGGNHDWNKGHAGGLKAIRRQGKLIEKSDAARILPRKGCPGPEAVELTDDVVLVMMDSQWWLQDWRTEGDINEDCDVKERSDFIVAFAELLKDYQEKQVIVALHHPLVSAGSHGGYYTVRDHLFPLTNLKALRNFYLPLPVLGSIYPIYRSNFGSIQDVAHPKYNDLKTGLLEAARFYDNVVFVSGHEHSLEYHKSGKYHFVVSGAGSRTSDIGKPRTLQYGHGTPGFVQMNLKSNGALDLLVWESYATEKGPAYRTALTPGVSAQADPDGYPELKELPDTVITSVSTRFNKGGLYRFAFGERYRKLYDVPVPAAVLDLSKAHGGLTPIKKGGGFQTNSLRLADGMGREFSARSMNKDASKLLPESFQNTFASEILHDQFSASHPFAAFIIPDMADQAGVYHTNPTLVYIPKQPALGRYAEAFGDQLYLFEERPSEEWSRETHFGECEDIVGFDDVVEDLMDDYRNTVDQDFTARSRLFDMFLGDWDRHDDQWRWAKCDRKDGKGKIYRPIPRDRDQAFAKYDGTLLSLAKLFTPTIRKLNVFSEDIGNLKWFNDNGKIFDRDFINRLTRERWIAISEELKSSLTDAVIEESIRQLSPDVFAKDGTELIATLKARRDQLPEFAARYYDILAKTVTIRATRNADFIEIIENPGQVDIRVYDSNKAGEKNEVYYSRTFYKGETREIQIYGLAGHDRVDVRGAGSGGIKVFFIGGEDGDRVEVSETGRHGNLKFQDTETREEVMPDAQLTYHQVGDDKNTYERNTFLYDYGIPKIIIAANPDDGFLLGGGAEWVRHGFQKSPFASKHSVDGSFAFATSSYSLHYAGEWTDAIGKLNAGLNARFDGPTFVQNFFGFGNESTELEEEDDVDFYRVRKQSYAVVPFIRAGQERGSSIRIQAGLEGHEVERTAGRFVSQPESGLPESVFEDNRWIVLGGTYQYKVLEHPMFTRRGVDFHLGGGVDIPIESDNSAHTYFKASLATYYQFKHLGKPVLATRVGMEVHGGDYQFYQGAILGGQGNFRGMRKERLVGDRMFYHNTDLRFLLTRWRSYYLPAALGLQVSFDHGRVWLGDDDASEVWHYAYGGGLWMGLFETFLISVNYHKSDLDQRFTVGMGFMF